MLLISIFSPPYIEQFLYQQMNIFVSIVIFYTYLSEIAIRYIDIFIVIIAHFNKLFIFHPYYSHFFD
ncbi:MAG: hypothetical protein BGN88_04300 [Clostridiales bacterium 43-6]|nr:MAG: hypothetical protein BGN88_04300 [Clostridiales bacterium 43-6]